MIFKRRRRKTDPPYLREGEELLRDSGWQRVSGEGRESVWTDPTGAAWVSFEEGITQMALLVAPDFEEEKRWLN